MLLKDVFVLWKVVWQFLCSLLSKVVELWQLCQLYNFAKLRKLPKVEVDIFLMYQFMYLAVVYL